MTQLTNWAGNLKFRARGVCRPQSVAALQAILARGDKVRALGTGHSFNDIADTTGDLISLTALPPVIEIDSERRELRVGGGLRYGDVMGIVQASGLALPNTGSLPHIAIAGACATGTHGSGDTNRVLAAGVSAMTVATAGGELVELRRGDDDFLGAVLGLGGIGIVTELTVDLVPTFDIAQYVYLDLAADDVIANVDEILGSAYSVSIFARWHGHRVEAVWLKSAQPRPAEADFFGGRPATGAVHPVAGVNPEFTTEQLGVAGPWHERLPHFRLEFTPSNGDELQSEYFVDRRHAADALRMLDDLGEIMAPVLLASEIRSVAADELWISPANGRERVALHFTWVQDERAVAPVLAELERRLATIDAVPHWGKVFGLTPEQLAPLHPRLADFAALARRYDPAGMLANDFMNRFVRHPFGG